MLAMTGDHVAWRFLDFDTHLSETLHFFGRLVAPLMCYFLVVGFYHTSNVKQYAKRLFIFALIAQLPFWLFNLGIDTLLFIYQNPKFINTHFLSQLFFGNVLFSLFLSLIALMIWHNKTFDLYAKLLLTALLYPIISLCDYGFAMIAMTLLFAYFYTKNKPTQLIMAYLLSLPMIYVLIYGFNQTVGLGYMHFGMILTALLIYGFNGKKGNGLGGRYVFYWFYPVHLAVIAVIEFYFR